MNVKLVPVCLGLSLLFIVPQVSFATSGACSYHGGANCSSGPGPTGKVMCNDGWEDSSVWYGDASACNAGKSNLEILSDICRYYPGWTDYYKGRLDKYNAEISILPPTYTPSAKSTNDMTGNVSKCTESSQNGNAYDNFLSCLTHESDRLKDESAKAQAEYESAKQNQDEYFNNILPALQKQADRKAFDDTLNACTAKADQVFKSIPQVPEKTDFLTQMKKKYDQPSVKKSEEVVISPSVSEKKVLNEPSLNETPTEMPWYRKVLKFFSNMLDAIMKLLKA